MIYLTTAHTVNINLYSYSNFTFMFSVVLPTRKNYGFHLNQSTVMEQQDKIRDIFILKISFSTMQMEKNAKWNLFESINSSESSEWKICSILSKCCLWRKKPNPNPFLWLLNHLIKERLRPRCYTWWELEGLFPWFIMPDPTVAQDKSDYSWLNLLFIHKALQFSISLCFCAFSDDLHSSTSWETLTSKMKHSQLTGNHQKEPLQQKYLQALGHASNEKSRRRN